MANEAVALCLYGNPPGEPVNFKCSDGYAIEKGTLLYVDDNYYISGTTIGKGDKPFAGIAMSEKVAGDGSTTIAVYTKGIFDIFADGAITAGNPCILSGANKIAAASLDQSGADVYRIVGQALETASAQETIAVRIGY